MRSAIRASLFLAVGVVTGIALAVPASARVATAAPTVPGLHASNCATGPQPHDFTLADIFSGDQGEIDPSTQDLYLGGGVPQPMCQALVSAGVVQIFTTSTDYCLAYSMANNNAYQHAPAACQSASPPKYMQWRFISIGQDAGATYYELQNEWNGTCMESLQNSHAVTFVSCSDLNVSFYEPVLA